MKKLILICFVASLCACGNQTSSTTVEESDSTMVVDTLNVDSLNVE